MAAQGKALRVLEAAASARSPFRLKYIVETTGLSKTTAFRLLQGLVDEGYLTRREDGAYTRGAAMMLLAARLSDQDVDEVRVVLGDLQTRVHQTVHLGIRSGDHAIYTHKVEPSDQAVRMASRPGNVIALHTTAIGKAILACLDESEVRQYAVATGLPRHTANSLASIESLLEDLELTKARGWAMDDEENEPAIRCIAAPVLEAAGHPTGAVSISTIAPLIAKDKLAEFAAPLTSAAAKVAGLLQPAGLRTNDRGTP